jgi:hypothetical protein
MQREPGCLFYERGVGGQLRPMTISVPSSRMRRPTLVRTNLQSDYELQVAEDSGAVSAIEHQVLPLEATS